MTNKIADEVEPRAVHHVAAMLEPTTLTATAKPLAHADDVARAIASASADLDRQAASLDRKGTPFALAGHDRIEVTVTVSRVGYVKPHDSNAMLDDWEELVRIHGRSRGPIPYLRTVVG